MKTLGNPTSTAETTTRTGTAAVLTGVIDRRLANAFHQEQAAIISGWNRNIVAILTDWAMDPEALNDGESTPPTLAVIQYACDLAEGLRSQGYEPPDRVVLDGDGGIVFERRRDCFAESIAVYGEHQPVAELTVLEKGKVVFRQPLELQLEL